MSSDKAAQLRHQILDLTRQYHAEAFPAREFVPETSGVQVSGKVIDAEGHLRRGRIFECRIIGEMKNTDFVMNQVFWLGVFPGLTPAMLDYIADTAKAFVAEKVAQGLKVLS